MSLFIKEGVRILGIRPEMTIALQVIEGTFKDANKPCTITAVIDGKHMAGSLHYIGCAVDIRSRDLQPSEQEAMKAQLQKRLTSDFDVVLEGDHFHIEFQPKTPYTGVDT